MHRIEQMAAVYNQTYLELSDAGDPSSGDDKFPRGGDIYTLPVP